MREPMNVKFSIRLCTTIVILKESLLLVGHAVAQLVEALRYKLEGRGFDSR
jgi:hypothetical protein